MKVSYRWLSEYVDLSGYTAADLAEKLTRSGIEVDVVENRNKGVEGVVVGYVKSREKHPDADKLSVCVVDAGQGEDLQIVCGAKNVAAGQKVPVALVGASLPDGLRIKRAKLRGVESQGMICSAKELGLNDRLLPKEIQEGILVLPQDTPVRENILDVLAIADEVLELDLTPNRADCLSMIGVAYEIAAIIGRDVKLPDPEAGIESAGFTAASRIGVKISAPEQCQRYAARLIEGVRIGPAPLWMQNRLMAAGIRPINNIVDITNFVMLEYGQPLHAFDADHLAGGRIDVRLASEGERLVTLDGQERRLAPHMLLITDGEQPAAVAGVMGGADSEVTDATTRILLESARFAGSSVRITSKELGLRSEASIRFEKEVNPGAVIDALNRAAALMCQYAGGKAADGIVDEQVKTNEPVRIQIDMDKINGYLGTDLKSREAAEIFDRLHFSYRMENGRVNENGEASVVFHVDVPSRRGDITRAVDLIEEVARLHGYDQIPTTLMTGVTTPGSLTREQAARRTLRAMLTQTGLNEVVTYTFTHPDQIALFPGRYASVRPIPLAMPMSEERSTLRTSLIPQLLEVASYNRNRNNDDVAIFEIGKAFLTNEESLTSLPEEKPLLSLLMTGKREAPHWSFKQSTADFYDMKGVLEKVFEAFGIRGVEYRQAAPDNFHPGRTAEVVIGGETIGYFGQLHPDLQRAKDLEDTYIAELELDAIYRNADYAIRYAGLPRFPAIGRDIAVVVGSSVPVGSMEQAAKEAAGALLESIRVFDVYTGERLGADKKSVAISLVYRHAERTLTDEEVTELHGRVVSELESRFGAELRK